MSETDRSQSPPHTVTQPSARPLFSIIIIALAILCLSIVALQFDDPQSPGLRPATTVIIDYWAPSTVTDLCDADAAIDLEVTSLRIATVARYERGQRIMEVLGDVYRGVALHGERIEFADTVRIAEPLNPLVRPAGNIIESHPRELDLRLQHNYVVVVGYDTDLHAYVPAFGPNGVFESKEDSLVQLAGHLSVDEKTAGAFLDRLQRDCASRPRRPH